METRSGGFFLFGGDGPTCFAGRKKLSRLQEKAGVLRILQGSEVAKGGKALVNKNMKPLRGKNCRRDLSAPPGQLLSRTKFKMVYGAGRFPSALCGKDGANRTTLARGPRIQTGLLAGHWAIFALCPRFPIRGIFSPTSSGGEHRMVTASGATAEKKKSNRPGLAIRRDSVVTRASGHRRHQPLPSARIKRDPCFAKCPSRAGSQSLSGDRISRFLFRTSKFVDSRPGANLFAGSGPS